MDSSPLVVVGAGACGMVAALAAARRGVRVLILEKETRREEIPRSLPV
jgi:thioredoxin reductase